MLLKNKRLIILLGAAAASLLVPLVAMQFTNQVDWKLPDFIGAGCLLFGTSALCEFVLRKVKTMKYRIVLCVIILIGLLLIWTELAVGLFGTPFAGS